LTGTKVDEHKNDCLVCGKELTYRTAHENVVCHYCKEPHDTNATCVDGHYVCDRCHGLKGNDLIEVFCTTTEMIDPIQMAVTLMKHPEIKMHGPEHHFLVPAVLLSAYCNATGSRDKLQDKIKKARQRADHVLGGFCGFYGDCGAAVGTGIFLSVLTGATPLSTKDWRLSNLMTAQSLFSIANHGGPRCCKRNSFLALAEAVGFLKEHFAVDLPVTENPTCEFTSFNKECLTFECPYYN
jgi:hypothetical protein